MYLLATQEFVDLASRDEARQIFDWLKTNVPSRQELFVSALSIGMLAHTIEELPNPERGHWRRLLAEARREFVNASGVISVDLPIVDVWSNDLRGLDLFDQAEGGGGLEIVGEDERLVIATAIARGLTYVSRRRAYLDEICERTKLTVVTP